jgi:tetratricopeptide (TPR) repeat protein
VPYAVLLIRISLKVIHGQRRAGFGEGSAMTRRVHHHRVFSPHTLLFTLLALAVCIAAAQTTPPDDEATLALRKQALELYRQGKFVDAMPLLGQLSMANSNDFVVKEHWAYCILEYSKTQTDPEQRKASRIKARDLAIEAKKLGDEGELLQVLLSLPEDGSELKFSERPDVDQAMKAAEANRAKGDLDQAREGYLHVLHLDPKNYDATVYVGDAYFSQHAYDSAGEWFAKAIKLDPDKETAYRYWADALAASGKNDEARRKYIEAVLAQPYTRTPWMALRGWSDRMKQPFNAIVLQNQSSAKKATDKAVNLDDSPLKEGNPEAAGWQAYDATRLTWEQQKFKKEFPQETAYRRSLREEAEALDAMVAVLAPDAASIKKAEKLDPSLLALIRLDHDGLLEPFVLLNRADRDIAKDYPAYRAAHFDKLYRYVDEILLPKPDSQATK